MAAIRKIVGEIRLADKGSKPLKSFNTNMNKASKSLGAVPQKTRKASAGFDKMGRSAEKAGKKAKKAGAGLKSFAKGAAGILGVGLFVSGVKNLVSAFKVQEQVEFELEQRLKSTKNAVGLTADEIKNMASALQNVTTAGDEVILSGQNLLLTFTNIGKDVFPEVTETMLNMTAALNLGVINQSTMKTTALLLGKALNDPVKGISALTRVGVKLTESQIKQIKAFGAAGETVKAQKVILKELEVQFGGTARAMAQGTGAFDQLGGIIGDVKEQLGGLIVEVLLPLVPKIKAVVLAIKGFLETKKGIFAIKAAFVLLATVITAIFISSIIAMLAPLATLATFLAGISIPGLISLGVTIFTTVVPALFAMTVALLAPLLPFILIGLAIVALVALFFIFKDKIISLFVATWQFVKDGFFAFIDFMVTGFFQLLDFAKKFGKFFIIAIFPLAAIFFFKDEILAVVKDLISKLTGFLSKIPFIGKLFSKGKAQIEVKGTVKQEAAPEKAVRVAGSGTTGRVKRKVNDALITSGGDVIEFSPGDNILATKTDPRDGGLFKSRATISVQNLIGNLTINAGSGDIGDSIVSQVRSALEMLSTEFAADLGLN